MSLWTVFRGSRPLTSLPRQRHQDWEWGLSGGGAQLFLTDEQLDRLRQDPYHGRGVEVREVSEGPWEGYWKTSKGTSLYLTKAAELVLRDPLEGPYTLTQTAADNPDAWWLWQSPEKHERPTMVYKSRTLLGLAFGDLFLDHRQEAGRGRALPVLLSL